MKQLPIGLNSLRKIISERYIYVDKTKYLLELIENGNYYFLSRPRRFGKTLTVDTLKNIFEGNKELFKGLYIYDKWDWSKKYPVIRIDFSGGNYFTEEQYNEKLFTILEANKKRLGITCNKKDPANCFYELISEAYGKYRAPVVVLIDEYDKPILDNIENPEQAERIRDLLANFYGVLKGLDEYLRFVFLTGVTKFSKVNLFSKLNNLYDITINRKYSALCGYTEEELDIYFKKYLEGTDREKVRQWYNGYSWLGEKVYNPFDILLFIANEFQFSPYWFETGTPTFLMKLIKQERYFIPDLEELEVTDETLGSFDVYNMELEALLWQTGYLTIKGTRQLGVRQSYLLSYPNQEVKLSLSEHIVKYLTGLKASTYSKTARVIFDALVSGGVEKLIEHLKSLFSSISYTNFTKNEIDSYEGYYASVIYAYLASLGVKLIAEDVTNKGRIDLTIVVKDKAYILEFKVKENFSDDKSPLEQIKEKRYYEKYREKVKEIYLIGITFSREERNIVGYQYEKLSAG